MAAFLLLFMVTECPHQLILTALQSQIWGLLSTGLAHDPLALRLSHQHPPPLQQRRRWAPPVSGQQQTPCWTPASLYFSVSSPQIEMQTRLLLFPAQRRPLVSSYSEAQVLSLVQSLMP